MIKTYFYNLPIRYKLLFGFAGVLLILLALGVRQNYVLLKLDEKEVAMVGSLAKSEAILEAKYFIRSDMHLMYELITAQSEEAFLHWWDEHLFQVIFVNDQTDKLKEALSDEQKADTSYQKVYSAGVEVANIYNNYVVPAFEKMYHLKYELMVLEGKAFPDAETLARLDDGSGNFPPESPETWTDWQRQKAQSLAEQIEQLRLYVTERSLAMIRILDIRKAVVESILANNLDESAALSFQSLLEVNLSLVAGMALSVVIALFIANLITKPVNMLSDMVARLGRGELPEVAHVKINDEVGHIASVLNDLIRGIKKTALFAEEIGRGQYESHYEPLSGQDVLGNSLVHMRRSLMEAQQEEIRRKIEDSQRQIASEGVAKFGEILRRNSNDLAQLADDVITNLVDYMGANQGGLFLLNDEEANDHHLQLLAAYAYDRKKFLTKRIDIGEGLVGTCALEKKTIHLTEIPENYIEITSGLGQATPNTILIVPLVAEGKIQGILEMASFAPFEDYEIQLIEKIAESVGVTMASVKTNAKNRELLERARMQAEELISHEEEMRQNLEEMRATQEDAFRREAELQDKIDQLEDLKTRLESREDQLQTQIARLEALNDEKIRQIEEQMGSRQILEESLDGVIVIDEKGIIKFFNPAAQALWGYAEDEVVGRSVNLLMPNREAAEHDSHILRFMSTGEKRVIGRLREMPIKTKDGSVATIGLSVIEQKYGSQSRFVGFVKNLEQVKALEEALRQNLGEFETRELAYQRQIRQLQEQLREQGNAPRP